MTENYPTGTTPPSAGEWPETEQDTTQLVKDQASDLANSGVQAGKHVGDVAREQASGVAAEAGRQGRNLLEQAQGQLHEQAAEGQQRIAKKLLSLSDELRSMADNSSQGVTVDVAQQAASRVRDAGHWLEKREPGQVVNEVQSFARRRPAVLLTAGHKDQALLVARTRHSALARLRMHRPPALSRWPVLAPLVPGGSHYPHSGGLHNKLMTETYVGSLRRPLGLGGPLTGAAPAGRSGKTVRGAASSGRPESRFQAPGSRWWLSLRQCPQEQQAHRRHRGAKPARYCRFSSDDW